MSESKMFALLNGITPDKIVAFVEGFMRNEKGMMVQSAQTVDGYVIQGSQAKDGWKTISGTRLAITVQMTVMGQNMNVTIGEGQWSDKLGAGALGWFIAWPLAVTAGFGAYKQKKLPAEIFAVIERCILTGGQSAVISGASATLQSGQQVCPSCKAVCAEGARFCHVCGTALSSSCPACGAPVQSGSRFCSSCGKPL